MEGQPYRIYYKYVLYNLSKQSTSTPPMNPHKIKRATSSINFALKKMLIFAIFKAKAIELMAIKEESG